MFDAKKVLLVKYGEISLRKGNRAHFEHELLDAIRRNIKDINRGNLRVLREQGRFLIEDTNGDIDAAAILPRIRFIFGITGFSHAIKTDCRDIVDLCVIGQRFFSKHCERAGSFKIETKRSDKQYPLTSTEISAAIGDYIWKSGLGLKVDVRTPDIILWVEIRNHVYFYIESDRGEGGLPYGSSGKGVLLLSGGFDSPVAGYLAGRRGVEILPVYFHSPPFVSPRAQEKVNDLARELARFTGRITLCTVNFTEVQLFLRDEIAEEKLTIFLKRAMLRIASMLAEKKKAQCLITGDAIGQVASQTVHSLAAMESATQFPILRPLAAVDKQDIINTAIRIGTYEISARPYEDCCTIFVAKHPENRPHTPTIEKIEARILDRLEPLLIQAFESAKYCEIL
ncbi:MAG: tRNA 4-thiouridine(8) synthase ThiI [Defluviitaleaceae bacterium]|nr:tRNA 4-thiouridine(8) synthase ThiI [Defluviitaleaceae bacterium]